MGPVDPQNRAIEERLARLASTQKGTVTFAELRGLNISATEIRHRVRSGALIRVYRGVYRVGHRAPDVEADYLAAVKACGEDALLAGLAAAYLYGLLKGDPPPPEVVHPRERSIRGVNTRRRRLHPLDRTTFRGIPILPVPAVLVDIAPRLGDDALSRACHEAGVRYRTTPSHVQAVLDRRPKSPAAGRLKRVMSGETKVTLSGLERAFLDLLRREGLPLPETNRRVGTKRVDCRWPEHKLTVELDSYRFHNTRHAWEQDLQREREAHAREDILRRYSHGDVFEDQSAMLSELRSMLVP